MQWHQWIKRQVWVTRLLHKLAKGLPIGWTHRACVSQQLLLATKSTCVNAKKRIFIRMVWLQTEVDLFGIYLTWDSLSRLIFFRVVMFSCDACVFFPNLVFLSALHGDSWWVTGNQLVTSCIHNKQKEKSSRWGRIITVVWVSSVSLFRMYGSPPLLSPALPPPKPLFIGLLTVPSLPFMVMSYYDLLGPGVNNCRFLTCRFKILNVNQ